ncbi:alpha/beta hydrolase [Pseudomonas lactis]|uniref:alpha/beta hydrolase n=1 Tax=Pseudomonas lactis TaxID=1615674 RepID=UPI00129490CE|nr:alpha/beta hydrolase [Pseudomonas lactis]MQB14763.1 alpha/beta hydrolase [Pseudomonas lactis]
MYRTNIERTSADLLIALAVLHQNFSTNLSYKRIISSAQILLCWKNAPTDTFVAVLASRILKKSALHDFEYLIDNIDKITLLAAATEAQAMLDGADHRGHDNLKIIKSDHFRFIVEQSVRLPRELIIGEWIIGRMQAQRNGQSLAESKSLNIRNLWWKSEINSETDAVSEPFTRYVVHYGTDRLQEPAIGVKFGGYRGEKVTYGLAEVSIPDTHKRGQTERPSFWSYNQKGNPSKHIVIHNVETCELTEWLEQARNYLEKAIKTQDLGSQEGLLFIHGYNVNFEEAIWRSAQLCHDLKFHGLMMCFSWASLGISKGYIPDTASVDASALHLEEYLTHVTKELNLSALHIIAHSMGNRALLSVLEKWTVVPSDVPISQIVLAAPDIDSDRFKQIGRVFNSYEQVTLYASKTDRAILASAKVHKNPRAGGADPMIVMNHLSAIDVSSAGKDMFGLGHSYFANTSKVFSDLFSIIRHRHKPSQRVDVKKIKGANYWELT